MGVCGSDLRTPTPSSMNSDQSRTSSSFSRDRSHVSGNSAQGNHTIPTDYSHNRIREKPKGIVRIVTTASLTNKMNGGEDEEMDDKSLDRELDKSNGRQQTAHYKDSERRIHFEDEIEMQEDISEFIKVEDDTIQEILEPERMSASVPSAHDTWINFNGKRALVTGAGKGVGRELSIKLAELGAEVVAVSRTAADLDELSKISPNIKTMCLDVGCWEATKSALQSVGDIDLLVNNAAITGPAIIDNATETDIDRCFDVNVKACINIGMMIANRMKERGRGGSIVNISSVASLVGEIVYGVYSTSKAALNQITRCMATQFGPYKIRVNSVCPTVIRTRMGEQFFDPNNEPAKQLLERIPLRKFTEVDEVVNPVLFLLSEKSSMITGVILPIDGGITSSS